MRKFKLATQERFDCYYAINTNPGQQKGGFSIDDKLEKIEVILKQLGKGGKRREDEKGNIVISFDSCALKQEFELQDFQFNYLLNVIKTTPWSTAERALNVKKLIQKLEGLPLMAETEKAEVEK